MKRHTAISGVLGLLALAALPASVSAHTVIDFDTDAAGNPIVHGQVIDDEYAALGVTFRAVNFRNNVGDRAVAFDTSLSNTRDPDLEAPFYDFIQEDFTSGSDKNRYSFDGDTRDGIDGFSNPGNILIIQENNTGCNDGVCNEPDDEGRRPAGFFEISFAVPVFLKSIDFFDIEAVENKPANEITLTDAGGNTILADSFFTPNTGGDFNVNNTSYKGDLKGQQNSWDRLFFNTAQVAMIRINMGGSGGFSNLAFSTEVPAPAPAALLALGAFALWRRRSGALVRGVVPA